MSGGAHLDLATLAEHLGLDAHLPECPDGAGPDWRGCRWCTATLHSPSLAALLDIRHDARQLLAHVEDGSVPWVVAAVRLLELSEQPPDDATIPSVREITCRLRRLLDDDIDRLRGTLRAQVAPNGPVERRCLRSARLLTTAAIQRPEHADVVGALSAPVRAELERVAALLSSDVQLGALLPRVEADHLVRVPNLRTQPEWGRFRRPRPSAPIGPNVEPGSLEALVIESLIDRVTESLEAIGEDLTEALPPVAVHRPDRHQPFSSRTRSTLWRIAHIDWHLTFVDTGHARCWNVRHHDGATVTDVPWQVAIAVRVATAHGFVSATHELADVREPVAGSTHR